MTPYQMEVNNAARYIFENRVGPQGNPKAIDIFTFSMVMGIIHCKDKAEIVMDIVNAGDAIAKAENRKKPLDFFVAKQYVEKN